MEKLKPGNLFAQLFSYILHPLLMATYASIIFFNSGHFFSIVNPGIKNTIYFLFIILTFLVPAILIPPVYFIVISSKKYFNKKRIKLLILAIIEIVYIVVYYYMNKILMPPVLVNIILSGIVLIGICLIISAFWNVSIYTCGIGGLLGFTLNLAIIKNLPVSVVCLFLILCCGIAATARLYLNKHNPKQVYVGILIGLTTVFGCMLFF